MAVCERFWFGKLHWLIAIIISGFSCGFIASISQNNYDVCLNRFLAAISLHMKCAILLLTKSSICCMLLPMYTKYSKPPRPITQYSRREDLLDINPNRLTFQIFSYWKMTKNNRKHNSGRLFNAHINAVHHEQRPMKSTVANFTSVRSVVCFDILFVY